MLFLQSENRHQDIHLYVGSNHCEHDAERDAEKGAKSLAGRINQGIRYGSDYEADIVEEIIDEIDENNIVTRNRYGALVLNSKNLSKLPNHF